MFVVLFDIDGTLIQTGGAGQVAFARTFVEDFGVSDLPAHVGFAGRSDRAIAEDIMRHHGIEPSEDSWLRFHEGYCRRLPETLPACVGGVLPGVENLLGELEQVDGVAVGLLTGNIVRGAEAKLSHYGLWDRFRFGGFGDQWTERNDIAADAVRVAKQTVFGPKRNGEAVLAGVMVIGDTLADVTCARSIGAHAVAVATGGNTAEELAAIAPDLLLDDLADGREILSHIRDHLAADGDPTARAR